MSWKSKLITGLAMLLAVILAVANRHDVRVSLDPFSSNDPAVTFELPLFWVMFSVFLVGAVLGGMSSWIGQGRWRREARRSRRQVKSLSKAVETQALQPPSKDEHKPHG